MHITYFTWLRSEIGFSNEEVDLPSNIKTVTDLLNWLKQRGDNYRKALSNLSVVNISVNGSLVKNLAKQEVNNGDKVSLFSPIAGG